MRLARVYAPNLFDCYADWYDCFVEDLHTEPSDWLKNLARDFFEGKIEL